MKTHPITVTLELPDDATKYLTMTASITNRPIQQLISAIVSNHCLIMHAIESPDTSELIAKALELAQPEYVTFGELITDAYGSLDDALKCLSGAVDIVTTTKEGTP